MYPPPGEVRNGRFATKTTLVWDAEKSVGSYNRSLPLSSLSENLGASCSV